VAKLVVGVGLARLPLPLDREELDQPTREHHAMNRHHSTTLDPYQPIGTAVAPHVAEPLPHPLGVDQHDAVLALAKSDRAEVVRFAVVHPDGGAGLDAVAEAIEFVVATPVGLADPQAVGVFRLEVADSLALAVADE